MTTPAWLLDIPDHLIVRTPDPNRDTYRAKDLIAYCEARGIRPTLLDIERERRRRQESSKRGAA